jgi:hypothetical protein
MPVCSFIIVLFGKIDGCNRIFLGWQRSLYEVRTTNGYDGEYDDDNDEVEAGRSDHKGRMGLENMCGAFAQIVIVVYLGYFPVPISLYYMKEPTNSHIIHTTFLLQHVSAFKGPSSWSTTDTFSHPDQQNVYQM